VRRTIREPEATIMKLLRTPLAFLCLSAALCAQHVPGKPRAAGEPRAWEHESSDLAVNPRMHFGTLSNGIRWAWMANSEPRQRAYARLHVDVGSLAERDSEQGMAHFLEHMAFNGSEHFPAGTLVEWFQKHGMAFGADTNASTSFSETVYKLDLPTSDEATLRSGLTMLGDVADGLLLAPDEVRAEIGVIDGEERERDSVNFRAGIAGLKDAFAGTLVATRIPIGVQSVRAAFTAESVRAFYERWYRPENFTVVLVGDLGELDPVPLITEAFADVAVPEGAPASEPPLGTPKRAADTFVFHSSEIPVVTISAERLKPYVDEPFDRAHQLRDLPLEYARRMLNNRFRELAKKEDAPFLAASAGEAGGLHVLDGEELSVTSEPARWREALAAAEQELRRAISFGFQQPELDELRKNALRDLDEAVARESTRATSSYVNELMLASEERYVPTDAATDLAVFKPAIEALTVEGAQAAFAEAWKEGSFRLSAIGGLDLGAEGGAALKAAWAESGKVEVLAPAAVDTAAFAYASTAEDAGEVVQKTHVEDLDFWQVRFANGVRLNVKQTDFRERQVLVSVRAGQGLLSLDPAHAELEMAADATFAAGGLQAHSSDDLRKLTAGRQVGMSFGVDQDAFTLGSGGRSGGTTPDDLLLQLELTTAYLQHPGFRDEGLREFKDNLEPLFEQLAHQPAGPIQTRFQGQLHGGDARFGFPTLEQLQGVTNDALKAWLLPELQGGPIEVSIVGDVDVEAAIAAVARTLGKLPERGQPADHSDRLSVKLVSGLHEAATVETEVPQAIVYLVFPTTDGREALVRRRLSMLGKLVSDRLRVEVREKLGVAYSPQAANDSSQVFPGYGRTQLNVAAEPAKADAVLEACLVVTDALAKDGVTADELERQREPLLKQLRDQMRTNPFWMNLLGNCQARPQIVGEMRTLTSDYESMQPEDLSALARRFFGRENASWIVVRPVAAEAKAAADSAPPDTLPVVPGGG
jgi:zinc protease